MNRLTSLHMGRSAEVCRKSSHSRQWLRCVRPGCMVTCCRCWSDGDEGEEVWPAPSGAGGAASLSHSGMWLAWCFYSKSELPFNDHRFPVKGLTGSLLLLRNRVVNVLLELESFKGRKKKNKSNKVIWTSVCRTSKYVKSGSFPLSEGRKRPHSQRLQAAAGALALITITLSPITLSPKETSGRRYWCFVFNNLYQNILFTLVALYY